MQEKIFVTYLTPLPAADAQQGVRAIGNYYELNQIELLEEIPEVVQAWHKKNGILLGALE